MAIKKYRAKTPGLRQATFDSFSDVTKSTPEKRLVKLKKKTGGRNAQGKITVRHIGGGAKRMLRQVDFKRDKYDIPAKVAAIEYDPGRGARLALLNYADGEKRYIVTPAGLQVGESVMSSREKIEIKLGNALPIMYIPAGIAVSCVEIVPGRGAKMARGAGNSLSVMGVEGDFAQVRLPSGEIRLLKKECLCTVGASSNADRRLIKIGSAGRKRHLGVRPTVRGTAMNPVDHPHGGGEGKQPIGLRHPKTPWGKPALGVPTRRGSSADRLIVTRRNGRKLKK